MRANDTASKEIIAYRTAILNFLQNYSAGDWIYPCVIHDALGLDINVVYQALGSLESDSIVEQYLELHCPTCHRFPGLFYKTIGDIPAELFCPSCGEKIPNPLSHIEVIYRMVQNQDPNSKKKEEKYGKESIRCMLRKPDVLV